MEKHRKPISTNDFNEILIEAIDEAFFCLGETVKTAIYFHLAKEFGLERHEIPIRLEDFLSSLEKQFGSGAMLLKTMFMHHLKAKLNDEQNGSGSDLLVPKFTFQEYVMLKRRQFENAREKDGLITLVDCEEKKEQLAQ
jgi:hypothetical protein